MVLGISSFTYGWSVGAEGQSDTPMQELDLIRKAIEFEVKCVQFGDNLPVQALSRARLDSMKKLAKEHSIRLEVGAREMTPANLSHAIRLAVQLDAPLLRFIIDGTDYEPTPRSVIEIIKAALHELTVANLTLGIENHDRFKSKELASIMDAIGSDRVGICLDCVNSMGAGEGLEYVSDILTPYTVNLHIKDFTVARLPHKMGFTITGVPAGTGMTNVPMLLEKLAAYGRCQSAVLEQWVPRQENLLATRHLERQWAEQGISYLKSLPQFKKEERNRQII